MNAPLPNELLTQHERRPVPPVMLEALRERFGDRCSTAQAVREQHGRDESPFDVPPPEVVVFCESTEEARSVVALAAAHAVPVIPFGIGSSLEGHTLAVQGGVCIDLGRMDKVLRVNPEDLTVTVQAGVTREQCVAGHDRFFGCSRPPGQAETRGRGALVGDRTDGQARLFRVLGDQDAQ